MNTKYLVPNEIVEQRLEICKSCDKFLPRLSRCNVCKCFMKIKARFKMFSCPENKWEKHIN